MLRYDYHTHTAFSDDSDTPMTTMVESAIERGVRDLAITDHYDPGYPDPLFPFFLDEENYFPAVADHQERYKEHITIAKGMEIGIMAGQFEEARRAVTAHPYDFIIGSFHCMRHADLHNYDYSQGDLDTLVLDNYLYIHECLQEFTDFDVLGHLSLIDRYLPEVMDYTPYMEVIREILKTLIDNGKGIELNTSNFKYGKALWLPRMEILTAYLELGGEIFTLGSDSHEPTRFMDHFAEAEEFVTSLGYRYYCTFKDHKPTFHPFA